MRLAVLADIHGNLPALEAVLADVRQHDWLAFFPQAAIRSSWTWRLPKSKSWYWWADIHTWYWKER